MLLDSLKVALISEEFPPFTFGGVSAVCYDLAYSLSKKRIFATVFCGRSPKLAVERVNDYLEVVRLPCFDFPPRFLWFQLQNFFSISRRLSDYIVIHAVSPEVSPICVYLKKKLRKPLVTSYHGYTTYEMKAFISSPFFQSSFEDFAFNVLEYPLYDAFNRLSIASSDHVIACSYAVLNELRSIYKDLHPEKSSVIYNGIDITEFDNARKDNVFPENTGNPTLIFYGRWFWSKGIHYLLEAFRLLLNEYPTIQLKICGKGPMERRIQAFICGKGLKNNIHVLGHVTRNELLSEIMKADVVVLPSLREAQPISVLEAMACKKPVVVFDFPFVSEYIQDSSNGLLAKAKDPKDLANKISILLSDKKFRRRLGQNAYKYVKQHHNWDNLVDKYIEVYKKVADLS